MKQAFFPSCLLQPAEASKSGTIPLWSCNIALLLPDPLIVLWVGSWGEPCQTNSCFLTVLFCCLLVAGLFRKSWLKLARHFPTMTLTLSTVLKYLHSFYRKWVMDAHSLCKQWNCVRVHVWMVMWVKTMVKLHMCSLQTYHSALIAMLGNGGEAEMSYWLWCRLWSRVCSREMAVPW